MGNIEVDTMALRVFTYVDGKLTDKGPDASIAVAAAIAAAASANDDVAADTDVQASETAPDLVTAVGTAIDGITTAAGSGATGGYSFAYDPTVLDTRNKVRDALNKIMREVESSTDFS